MAWRDGLAAMGARYLDIAKVIAAVKNAGQLQSSRHWMELSLK